jgi:hypothetical protein
MKPDNQPLDDEKSGPDRALDAVMNVRLTRFEKAQLGQEARRAGLSVSALVRRRSLGRRIPVVEAPLAMVQALRRISVLVEHLDRESAQETSPVVREGAQALRRELQEILAWFSHSC